MLLSQQFSPFDGVEVYIPNTALDGDVFTFTVPSNASTTYGTETGNIRNINGPYSVPRPAMNS